MPRRILRDVVVVDRSQLASNMYTLLFSPQTRFRARFVDEYETIFKRSKRLRPDLLIVNSNALPREDQDAHTPLRFPAPTILIISRDRFDLKEQANNIKGVILIEKPFYPYDLISEANRLLGNPRGAQRRRKKKTHG